MISGYMTVAFTGSNSCTGTGSLLLLVLELVLLVTLLRWCSLDFGNGSVHRSVVGFGFAFALDVGVAR